MGKPQDNRAILTQLFLIGLDYKQERKGWVKIRQEIIKLISTFFYVGYLPLIPGTFGSIAGLFLFFLIKNSIFNLIFFTSLLIILGFAATGEAENIFKKKDASYIVIDEVNGMLLSLLFLPYDIKAVIIAFFIFRILDTLKPFPADRFQNLRGSLGIMGDDVVAGIYTNIILQVALRLASFKAS